MSFNEQRWVSDGLLDGLPEVVRERVRPCSSGETAGEFVLVWMRTAVRAHENPALDAALLAADQLGLPVFVYHALSERYPYASDRHHRFILEGARDVAGQLAERGIGTAFHLERPGHRGPHLRTLAERAALVVTEDLPVPPLTTWTVALRDATSTPVWVVDTACVVPMRLVDRSVNRAFEFRRTYRAERAMRLTRTWRDHPVSRPHFVPADLPFVPVDLQTADLTELIASCDIDHGVAPVPHTRGGTAAGRARWEAFRDGGGLDRYANTRNAAQKDGTSRLSAYLHYGMVSPLRIARETAARTGRGPEKFLDELLIWRELAHAWCSHQSNLHSLEVLPDWAVESLEDHVHDPRPRRYSLERTGPRAHRRPAVGCLPAEPVAPWRAAQQCAHDLGQAVAPLDRWSGACPTGARRPQPSLCAGWARPELLRWTVLVSGALRPTLFAGATRHRPGAGP